MRSRSLRTLLQIILLAVLLGISSSAYADPISSISFNSFAIGNPAGNPITFGTWQGTVSGMGIFEGVSVTETASTSGGTVQTVATTPLIPGLGISFARGFGEVNAATVTGQAFGQAAINGCTCSASGEGQFVLSNTFVVTGGTGNVPISISLRLSTRQAIGGEFDVLSTAQFIFNLTIDDTPIFSVDDVVSITTPNSGQDIQASQFLSRTITLDFNTPHTITITGIGRATEVTQTPEPATIVLLISGVGLMSGVLRIRLKRFEDS